MRLTLQSLSPLLLLLFVLGGGHFAQAREQLLPTPRTLVNDSAHILSPPEVARIEGMLRSYWDSTSRQLFVVTVPDYKGYDANGFATALGNQWRAGRKGLDNGIIILLRPSRMPPIQPRQTYAYYDQAFTYLFGKVLTPGAKLEGAGRQLHDVLDSYANACANSYANRPPGDYGGAYIAVGYGLEGVVPDIVAHRVVVTLMRPLMLSHRYAQAIEAAAWSLIGCMSGDQASLGKPSRGGARGTEGGPFLWWLLLPSAFIALVAGVRTYNSQDRRFWLWVYLYFFFTLHVSLLRLVFYALLAGGRGGGRGGGDGFRGGEGGSFGGGGGGAEF